MPRQISEMYEVLEYATATSTGTSNIQTITPTKRCIGVWVSVETTAARMTFDNTAPGAGVSPGLVIPISSVPQFFPLDLSSAHPVKFASAAAGNSVVSVMFVI